MKLAGGRAGAVTSAGWRSLPCGAEWEALGQAVSFQPSASLMGSPFEVYQQRGPVADFPPAVCQRIQGMTTLFRYRFKFSFTSFNFSFLFFSFCCRLASSELNIKKILQGETTCRLIVSSQNGCDDERMLPFT